MCLLVWLHVSASSPATDTSCPEGAPVEGTQLRCHPEHPDPEETPDVVIHNWNVTYCWELDSNSYSAVALCIRCIFSAKMNVMQVAIAYQILFMWVHWNFQYPGGISDVLSLIFLPPICGKLALEYPCEIMEDTIWCSLSPQTPVECYYCIIILVPPYRRLFYRLIKAVQWTSRGLGLHMQSMIWASEASLFKLSVRVQKKYSSI